MLMHAHKPCCNKQPEMHSDNCAVNMQDVLFSQCLNLACGQFMSFMLSDICFHSNAFSCVNILFTEFNNSQIVRKICICGV